MGGSARADVRTIRTEFEISAIGQTRVANFDHTATRDLLKIGFCKVTISGRSANQTSRLSFLSDVPMEHREEKEMACLTPAQLALRTPANSGRWPTVYKYLNGKPPKWNKAPKPGEEKPPYSHRCQDGDIMIKKAAFVPLADLETFYEEYQNSIVCLQVVFMDESADRKRASRVVFDLDLYFREEEDVKQQGLCDEIVRTVSRAHQQILQEVVYDEDVNFECFISTSGVADTEKGSIKAQKIGIHLCYPGIYSTPSLNLVTRRAILVGFQNKFPGGVISVGNGFPPCRLYNAFEDVVDAQQLANACCRMVFSHKLEKCRCPDKKTCPHPNGKLDAGRPYRLFDILPSHELSEREETDHKQRVKTLQRRDNVARLLWLTSMRIDKPVEEATPMRIDKDYGSDQLRETIKDDAATGAAGIPVGPQKTQAIFDLIRQHPLHAKKLKPDSVRLHVEKKDIWFTIQSDDRWCPNKQGDHKSHTQWYRVTPLFAERRCWCRCVEAHDRLNNQCSAFVIKESIPQSTSTRLFSRKPFRPREEISMSTLFERDDALAKATQASQRLTSRMAHMFLITVDTKDDADNTEETENIETYIKQARRKKRQASEEDGEDKPKRRKARGRDDS